MEISKIIMSNPPDDEKSLLAIIQQSMEEEEEEEEVERLRRKISRFVHNLSENIYSIASYIINKVITLRLDDPEKALNGASDDRALEGAEVKLDCSDFEFRFIGKIVEEFDRAISTEMDVHAFAISYYKLMIRKYQHYPTKFLLCGPFAALALTHGIWLLVMKFICTDSIEDNILMALKRVEGLFTSLRRRHRDLGKEETQTEHALYIYISLLSSSVTKKPRDNWESMSSLYSLIKIMFEVGSLAHIYVKDVSRFTPKHMQDEFKSLRLLSIYWILSGVFTCSSECIKLPKNEYVIQDSRKLIDIQDKLISIHERLLKLESGATQHMEDEKLAHDYQLPNVELGKGSYKNLMTFFQSDNVRIVRCDKDMDLLSEKRRIFLLLISDLDISLSEIDFLKGTYIESKTSVQQDFELLWLPIHSSPWTTSLEGQYMAMLQLMSWYTISHPSYITEKTKTFIKDIWKFQRQPIIVVLNEEGRVVCPNAIHLLHIWGSKAFPFTRQRERTLWSAESSLSPLILCFDSEISSMLEAGKWVILYGGYNIDWIRKFTNCVQKVSSELGIQIVLIYVGTNREVNSLTSENVPLSGSPDMKKIWYFWTRLESLLISRYQTFATARDGAMDPIIQEVKKLLTYASAESWACLSTSSSGLMIHGLGDTMLQVFMDYESWKQNIHSEEFPKYFKNHVEEIQRQQLDRTCSRIVLRIDNKDTIENLKCPDCLNSMEKKIMYRCCHVQDDFK